MQLNWFTINQHIQRKVNNRGGNINNAYMEARAGSGPT